MSKKILLFLLFVLTLAAVLFLFSKKDGKIIEKTSQSFQAQTKKDLHPLAIEAQRQKEYPGSEIKIEETLAPDTNYQRHIVSYQSEGLKIFALLTVPSGQKPQNGWPVIVFNHGYIPPAEYKTAEKYVAYIDGFARQGYIVLKPDYRGHGKSEGKPEGAYYSDAYLTDVLNALASIKKFPDADPSKIGMWGHSMGGHLTLRSMVVSKDIKAGVIWAGVVASYEDMINNWRRSLPWQPSQLERQFPRPNRQQLIEKYGTPQENPDFWQSISPIFFTADISGPLQLHHGTADESVPWEFSKSLKESMEKSGKQVEYFTYEGADHNLSGPFNQAISRTVEFFNKHLK